MKFLPEPEELAEDQLKEAIEMLRAAATAAPDLPSIWVRMAELLEMSAALSEAEEAWRMAHRLVPNSPRISAALRRLETGSGAPDPIAEPNPMQKSEATSNLIQSKSEAPLDIDVLIADLQSGRKQTSIERIENEPDLVEQSEDDEVATETLAKIFEAQNLFAEAARTYDLLADREKDADKAEILHARAVDLRKRHPGPRSEPGSRL